MERRRSITTLISTLQRELDLSLAADAWHVVMVALTTSMVALGLLYVVCSCAVFCWST